MYLPIRGVCPTGDTSCLSFSCAPGSKRQPTLAYPSHSGMSENIPIHLTQLCCCSDVVKQRPCQLLPVGMLNISLAEFLPLLVNSEWSTFKIQHQEEAMQKSGFLELLQSFRLSLIQTQYLEIMGSNSHMAAEIMTPTQSRNVDHLILVRWP